MSCIGWVYHKILLQLIIKKLCFQSDFEFFKNVSFIKEKYAPTKRKSIKSKIKFETLYGSFIVNFWYQHHNVIVEITDLKYRLLSNHLFQRTPLLNVCEWVFFSGRVKKVLFHGMSLPCIPREEKTNELLFTRSRVDFLHADQFDVPIYFYGFCGGQKRIFLTTLIEKNCRNNSIQEYVKRESWLLLIIFYTTS